MNPNYFIKTISLSLILCTFSYGQLIWSEGNLKKVDQISLEIVVSGDQDPTWEEKLTQISLLFFEGYKLKINPKTFSPNMVINVSVLKSKDLFLLNHSMIFFTSLTTSGPIPSPGRSKSFLSFTLIIL